MVKEVIAPVKFHPGDVAYKYHNMKLIPFVVSKVLITVDEEKNTVVDYYDGISWNREENLFESYEDYCSKIKVKELKNGLHGE